MSSASRGRRPGSPARDHARRIWFREPTASEPGVGGIVVNRQFTVFGSTSSASTASRGSTRSGVNQWRPRRCRVVLADFDHAAYVIPPRLVILGLVVCLGIVVRGVGREIVQHRRRVAQRRRDRTADVRAHVRVDPIPVPEPRRMRPFRYAFRAAPVPVLHGGPGGSRRPPRRPLFGARARHGVTKGPIRGGSFGTSRGSFLRSRWSGRSQGSPKVIHGRQCSGRRRRPGRRSLR